MLAFYPAPLYCHLQGSRKVIDSVAVGDANTLTASDRRYYPAVPDFANKIPGVAMNRPPAELTHTQLHEEERALLEKESRYCSHGDTVHYAEKPKFFERCEGSYLYDLDGTHYLDLQMWYSAGNLGHAKTAVTDAL